MLPINPKNNKPFKVESVKNIREAKVQKMYCDNGWVVLKNGWPDLFCYNPATKECEFVEVKMLKQLGRKNGHNRYGRSSAQLRMHQYLEKAGIRVRIVHIE